MVCRGQHTCSCCPRLGTEPAEPCQEQGEGWQAANMNMFMNKFKRGSEWRDGSLAPASTLGPWLAGSLHSLFLTHCPPRLPGPVYINWWVGHCWITLISY